MADILRAEDYPPGFHLGFSFYLWVIYISLSFLFSIIFYLRARNEYALHRKQLLLGSVALYLGFGLDFLFIQIAALNLESFALYFSVALTLLSFSMIWFSYFWEKNVISYKFILTYYSIFMFLFILANTFAIVMFGETLFTLFTTIYLFLAFFIGILILAVFMHFMMKVIGSLRFRAFTCIVAVLLLIIGGATDHPPIINIAPDFLMIFTPLVLISMVIIWYYGFNGIINGITSFYQQERKCVVHRGAINKGDHVFYCPNCSAIYCEKCYSEVIKIDGCWNCGEGYKVTEEQKWAQKEYENSIVEDYKTLKKNRDKISKGKIK